MLFDKKVPLCRFFTRAIVMVTTQVNRLKVDRLSVIRPWAFRALVFRLIMNGLTMTIQQSLTAFSL